MKIVIINGAPRSGKDTFVGYCLDKLGKFGFTFSTVDFIKDIAKECGWNGEKTPEDRKFLSELKRLLTEWRDVPYQVMRREIAKVRLLAEQYGIDHNKFVIFIHCREPEEIERFVKEYDATTVLVRRPEVETDNQSNSSDSGVFDYTYDVIIWNENSLDHLKLAAEMFVEKITNF